MYKKNIVSLLVLLVLILNSGCAAIYSLKNQEEKRPVSHLSANAVLTSPKEVRQETIELLNNAKKSIFIEQEAINDKELLDLIIKKYRQGVEVRILLDGQRENHATLKMLKNQNISVHFYPAQKGQYQRIKMMIIDYKVAVFYGESWTSSGFNSHTLAVKLTGETAWTAVRLFNKDWKFTTTLSLELPKKITLPEDNIVLAANANVKQQIIKYIISSSSEIKVEAEQLSDPNTVQAILDAKNRGCRVKIIVNPASAVATPNTIKKFKDAGIEVRYYQHPLPLGFNLGIFDNSTIILSSSAWTYYTFVINHECSLTIPSPEAVKVINEIFEDDWKNGSQA